MAAAAWIVIDWRNLHGQFEGHGLKPTLPTSLCLADALSGYGFAVAGVSVGIALAEGSRGGLKARHDENKRWAITARDQGWEFLEGLLREENGDFVEKMTDSNCVLKVAELAYERPDDVDAVIVVSRDHDMVPAAELGSRRGLPTFLACSDPQDRRPGSLLQFTRPIMSLLAGKDPSVAMVDDVEHTRFLAGRDPQIWRVVDKTTFNRHEGWALEHETGWPGFLPQADGEIPTIGEEVCLAITDVAIDAQGVAIAWCTSHDDNAGFDYIKTARIVRRRDANRVEVDVDRVLVQVRCPVGRAEPPQSVLLRLQRADDPLGQQAKARLIGALEELPERSYLDGQLLVGRPIPVQVQELRPGQLAVVTDKSGSEYKLAVSTAAKTLTVGRWYAGAQRSQRERGGPSVPVLDAVSSALPL